jgi:hypothetical protein
MMEESRVTSAVSSASWHPERKRQDSTCAVECASHQAVVDAVADFFDSAFGVADGDWAGLHEQGQLDAARGCPRVAGMDRRPKFSW